MRREAPGWFSKKLAPAAQQSPSWLNSSLFSSASNQIEEGREELSTASVSQLTDAQLRFGVQPDSQAG